MSARDEEGGNGEATWICRDERLGKHPRGRKTPWIDLNWLHKNRSGKHRGDWERDGLPRRRGKDRGLLDEGWRTGTCGGGDGGGAGALPRWPSAQRLLTPARGSRGGGGVGVFFFWSRTGTRGVGGIKMPSNAGRGGLRIVGGRPRTGPIFRGIGGRFPAVNAEAVQTRELRRVRFQFTIPAFNSYFQTQP